MILGWGKARRATPLDPPRSEGPLCAIGDIHGRSDLLARALEAASGQVICVGDYVDRGADSAGVLRMLAGRKDVICLMGNHEEMMLDFLDDPARAGPRWLHFGGVETLASFGIRAPGKPGSDQAFSELRDALREALGPGLEDWLRALPSVWQSGNLVITHAGADPAKAIEDQDPATFRWGHPKLGQVARRDGFWVLRGHVIYDDPLIDAGVISIDTGAYATGRLTLAHFADGEVRFSEA
jgi:serine/threonine protein phosphatase 1